LIDPSFDGFQVAVAIVFALIALTLALFFAFAARQAGREMSFEAVSEAAYRARPLWLAFLVVLLGLIVCVTLFFTPYRADSAAASATVKVVGGQFYWTMDPESVPAGSDVVFEVTAADVNHGFGVYDPAGRLIGNVQAMPGFTNDLELRLDEPGTYLISCLEFCGLKHHDMAREFEVTED
jgi:cytochrome c oxidase subunit 2